MKAGPVYVHVPVEYVADMRAVVIVEFWAMMAGALPYGWSARRIGGEVGRPCPLDVARHAWSAEYAARPRIEINTRTNGKA